MNGQAKKGQAKGRHKCSGNMTSYMPVLDQTLEKVSLQNCSKPFICKETKTGREGERQKEEVGRGGGKGETDLHLI